MLLCSLTTLHVNSQLVDADFKSLLSRGIKGIRVIGDSVELFCHAKDCFYAFLLPVPGMITGIKGEVSKMAYMFSKSTNITKKI